MVTGIFFFSTFQTGELPPNCPTGTAPVEATVQSAASGSGPANYWECEPNGLRWPSREDFGVLDCAPGTGMYGPGPSGGSYCLPPRPDCGANAEASPNARSPHGWDCLRKPDCPPGTEAYLSPKQGWQCDNNFTQVCTIIRERVPCESNSGCKWVLLHQGASIPDDFHVCMAREECPKGTKFQGMAGGSCAATDERVCKHLRGWAWITGGWVMVGPGQKRWYPGICRPVIDGSGPAVRSASLLEERGFEPPVSSD